MLRHLKEIIKNKEDLVKVRKAVKKKNIKKRLEKELLDDIQQKKV